MQKIFSFFKNKASKRAAFAMMSNSFKDIYGEGFSEKQEELIKRYSNHLKKLENY